MFNVSSIVVVFLVICFHDWFFFLQQEICLVWSVFVGLLGLSFSRQWFLDSLDNLISVGIGCDCPLIDQFHVDVDLFFCWM